VSLAYVHAQIERSDGSYTSFCNLNDEVNCDRVLTSPFATLLGIPIAWYALLTYIGLVLAFLAAAGRDGATRLIALRFAALTCVGAAAFSIYMAAISLFVLHTVCLLCTGLYLIAALLVAIIVLSQREYLEVSGGGQALLTRGALPSAFLASLAAIAAIAALTWPANRDLPLSLDSDLDTIRAADPEFYEWYTSLPVVDLDLAVDAEESGKPVTIVEFSDFECGYCAKNHRMLTELKARMPKLVNVVYRHFPLDATCNDALETSVHLRACRAALAAECARAQGRFEPMVDGLFHNQRQLFDTMLEKIATKIGLDLNEFHSCMEDGSMMKRVLSDARLGSRLKLTSTPTLFLNGRRVKGTFDDAAGYDRAVLIEARLAANAAR
jgi:protein-disulfide isomerase